MTGSRAAILVLGLTTLFARPAFADLTGFVGATTTPANRAVKGGALGFGLLFLSGELEYASTPEDPSANAPALTTGSANILLQTPVSLFGFQPYVTTGLGYYSESLRSYSHNGFTPNVGGGVKFDLLGPLRLRVDYRVFKLGSSALYSPVHRVYAGINLKF